MPARTLWISSRCSGRLFEVFMPDLSFTTLWPMVQVILEPFAPLIQTIVVIAVALLLLGIFWKLFGRG